MNGGLRRHFNQPRKRSNPGKSEYEGEFDGEREESGMDGSGHQNADACQSQTQKPSVSSVSSVRPSSLRSIESTVFADRGALLGRRLSRIENDNDDESESDWGRLVTLSRGPSRISCEAPA